MAGKRETLMKTIFRVCGAIFATMLALGCKETTSSQFIRTGGIAALMSVTADNPDASTLRVELDVGGPDGTAVILDAGDKLSATADGETQDLASVSAGVYEATFKTVKAVDFKVSLDRAEDEDAPSSVASLPDPFTINSPIEDDMISRANAFQILWAPVVAKSDGGTIDISGTCIVEQSFDIAGTEGTFGIDKGVLKDVDAMKPASCKVSVTMTFTDHGTVDPAFDQDSTFTTKQTRTVTFTSTP